MCHYCMIVSKQLPASIIYEDRYTVAFLVIKPISPGHVVVIPKTHVKSLKDLSDVDGGHLFSTVKKVDKALQASDLDCEGVSVYLADGEAAGQRISHLHLHLIPRVKGDKLAVCLDFDSVPFRGVIDLKEDAQKVRDGFKRIQSTE